jgi:hypothetical protein
MNEKPVAHPPIVITFDILLSNICIGLWTHLVLL